MRTIIDLPEEQIAALDQLGERDRVSRAELVRRAVSAYLEANQTASLKDLTGFGAWKHKRIDGVAYQRKLRAEWDE